MTAGQVGANRVRSAGLLAEAFVDVFADGAAGLESRPAEALAVHAFGVGDAVEIAFAVRGHVDLFAGHLRAGLSGVSLRADARVAGHGILADGRLTARVGQHGALVNVFGE